MSDQDTPFTKTSPQEQTQAQEASTPEVKESAASNVDPYADLLKTITNEAGAPKYASVPDALNSIPHAQTHISNIQQENKTLKEQLEQMQAQLEKVNKMESVLEQLSAKKGTEQPSSSLGEQQVAELVKQQISLREQQQQTLNNQQKVAQTLTERFGDSAKAEQAYRAKAQELGIDVAFMNDLAAKSPSAVLSYFNSVEPKVPSKSVSGSVSTEQFSSSVQQPKGRSPLLAGSSTKDLMAAWERVGIKS